MPAQSHRAQLAEQVITRLRNEPDHPWHISRNLDGGSAAEDFIRNFDVRQGRTAEEKDADRIARCLAALQQMGAPQ